VQLIPNKNVGGSGGFARGLVEALQENTYSHFLFMDDDIELVNLFIGCFLCITPKRILP